MKKKITIAIILARGGSKGIPGKNIKNFLGKPLLIWTIIQAKISQKISKIYLSSDLELILEIGKKYGIETIKRPKNISGDHSKSEEAILHLLKNINYTPDGIVMLEPTAPLREPNDIDNCINYFYTKKLDSCFSGAILEDFLIWKKNKEKLKPMNYNYKQRISRQLRNPQIKETGAIYVFKPKIINKFQNRLGGKIGYFTTNLWQSFEIDNLNDWKLVGIFFKKFLLKKYNKLKLNKQI
jgi:CMP-N,N'-diacetyllegionaminic acid synthase